MSDACGCASKLCPCDSQHAPPTAVGSIRNLRDGWDPVSGDGAGCCRVESTASAAAFESIEGLGGQQCLKACEGRSALGASLECCMAVEYTKAGTDGTGGTDNVA